MEIERKYLIQAEKWQEVKKPKPISIKQGYISVDPDCTVRVRTKGRKGYLTIKGKTNGISREEFEYEIPIEEAEKMLSLFADKKIIKNRYEIKYKRKTWEVDEFLDALSPLMLAEIELKSETEQFELPDWIGEEVSDDPSYYNSNLINRIM